MKMEKWAMENYNDDDDAPIRMRLFHIFLKLLLLFCITHTPSRFKYTTFDNKLCSLLLHTKQTSHHRELRIEKNGSIKINKN